MINLSNPLTKSSEENLQKTDVPQKQKLRLLLILSPSALEKGEICFAGVDLIVAKNINEAKQILNVTDKNFFDAVICDCEITRQNISDLSAFLISKKILNRTPLLLLLLNEHTVQNLRLNNIEGVDDIISCNTSISDLAYKIKILKKFKHLQDKLPYHVERPKKRVLDRQYILKRSVDIILSAALLLFLLPLIIIISVAIKIESKGPVFYKSKRAGEWYKVFTFFKFRTMVVNADSMIADLQYMNEYKDFQKSFFFKMKDDPRVTRIGRLLRKTSLDELPQLINVLKGDMSLVGNRPLPLYEAQTITVDKSAKRFFAPAGITGLWQVKGRANYDLTVQERINMDIDYANKHSFLFDMKILLKTPKELIQKHNV
ncbi:MAG TPA: sugar transferase [Parafilimonas sp.]|jgi:lipopolysaccharide/colanic/teichoic acid biosynthesis glycosyltransferase